MRFAREAQVLRRVMAFIGSGMARGSLSILGTRGIPACHGGFETFAERLALHLAAKGWDVTVYCQGSREASSPEITESYWRRVRLVKIAVAGGGALGSVLFDWKAVRRALRGDGEMLTLGYNTALFGVL